MRVKTVRNYLAGRLLQAKAFHAQFLAAKDCGRDAVNGGAERYSRVEDFWLRVEGLCRQREQYLDGGAGAVK